MSIKNELKSIKNGFIAVVALSVIYTVITFWLIYYSGSASFYLILGMGILISLKVTMGLLSFANDRGERNTDKIFIVSYVIALVLFIITFYYGTIGLLNEWKGGYHITNEFWTIVLLLVLLTIDYYVADHFDKITYNLIRSAGRYIADELRRFISAFGIAIIGLYGYLFTLRIVEPIMASLVYIYVLSVFITFIKESLKLYFSKSYKESIINQVKSILLSVPTVKEISNLRVKFAGFFASIYASVKVASILSDKELDLLRENLTSRLIFEVSFVTNATVELQKDSKLLKIYIPMDEETRQIVEPTKANALYYVQIERNGKINVKEQVVKIAEDYDDPLLNIRELALKEKIDGFVLKGKDKTIENELNGWFIKIIRISADTVDKAVERLRELAKA